MKALTVEQIGAWERNGFLKVENFVDADELADIRRIMEGLVERDPPHENTLVDIDPVLADRTDIPRTEKFRALMHAAHASRELLETYTLRPRTLDVVEDLIGPDIVYYTDQTFLKPPGGSGAPAHQDNGYWDVFWSGKGKLSVWLALDDSTLERGCTQFVPGSHREVLQHDRDFSKDALFGGAVPGPRPRPTRLRGGGVEGGRRLYPPLRDHPQERTERVGPLATRAGHHLLQRTLHLHRSGFRVVPPPDDPGAWPRVSRMRGLVRQLVSCY